MSQITKHTYLGGYVYHLLDSGKGQQVYRDGASPVPDLLTKEISDPSTPTPIVGLTLAGKVRESVDRYGNEYRSFKVSPGGTGIGFSAPINTTWGAVYLGGHYDSIATSQRTVLEEDEIKLQWSGEEGSKFSSGFGNSVSIIAGNIGIYHGSIGGNPYTMITRNPLAIKISIGAGNRWTEWVGENYAGWGSDDFAIGVFWEEAVNATAIPDN